MSKVSSCPLFLGVTMVALLACVPSPTEVAKQVDAAVNARQVDAALALVAPEAASELKPYLHELVTKNTKLELVGQYQAQGNRVIASEKITNDDYVKLGIAPLSAGLDAAAVSGKLTGYRLTLTPESQVKLDAAFALQTKKVVDDFEAALNDKKLDAAVELFSNEAMLTTIDGTAFKGPAEIKGNLAGLMAQNAKFNSSPRTVVGTKVSWTTKIDTDELQKAKLAALEAQAEAIVEGGKLTSVVLTLTPEAAARLASPPSEPPPPPEKKPKSTKKGKR